MARPHECLCASGPLRRCGLRWALPLLTALSPSIVSATPVRRPSRYRLKKYTRVSTGHGLYYRLRGTNVAVIGKAAERLDEGRPLRLKGSVPSVLAGVEEPESPDQVGGCSRASSQQADVGRALFSLWLAGWQATCVPVAVSSFWLDMWGGAKR